MSSNTAPLQVPLNFWFHDPDPRPPLFAYFPHSRLPDTWVMSVGDQQPVLIYLGGETEVSPLTPSSPRHQSEICDDHINKKIKLDSLTELEDPEDECR